MVFLNLYFVFLYYNNKQIDHKRFNIYIDNLDDVGGTSGKGSKINKNGKVFKFRVSSELVGKLWVEGLNEWRDWFLLNWA